jgi:ribose-phosphate pyrophosphokinase
MARAFAKRLGGDLILIDKRRPRPNEAEAMNIIGEVKGRNILIVDDLIDTGGTFCAAVEALKDAGAKQIYGACTHAVLSGKASDRLNSAPVSKLLVTDTIDLDAKKTASKKVQVLTVADIFGDAILRGFQNLSISSLFDVDKG